LLVGLAEDGEGGLRYAGRVGTGMTEQDLERLAALLAPLEQPASPFRGGGARPPAGAIFCAPRLICEVEFAEWTRDGLLRAPSFKGLRDDKEPAAVRGEEGLVVIGSRALVDGRELALANLGKVLYPAAGTTKRDVIDYYAAVAPALLPHLADR